MSFTPTAAAGSKIEIQVNATGSYIVIEGAEGIPEYGGDRAWIESVPINAMAKQFVADIPDYGEFTLAGERQASDTGQNALRTAAAAIPGVAQGFKVTYSNGEIGTFLGIVGGFKQSAAKGQTLRFSSKIKVSGSVSWS